MGRTLKRVPLDFSWPLDKTWEGYLNPFSKHAKDCPFCGGTGESPEARELHNLWYGYSAFVPADRDSVPFAPGHPAIGRQATRNYPDAKPEYVWAEAKRLTDLVNGQWCHHLNQDDVDALLAADRLFEFRGSETPPTPAQVNEAYLFGLGHDSINSWVVIKARLERDGLPATCGYCKGDGTLWDTEENKAASEAWQREEPPTGEGFQLWETTSEGSPISPVFDSLIKLAQWCEGNATTFGSFRASAGQWQEMLENENVFHQEGNAVFI